MYSLIKPFLLLLNAERSHTVTLKGAQLLHNAGLLKHYLPDVPDVPVQAMGLTFPNPIGLAAGMDKNAQYLDVWNDFGFGFVEVGTVTPRPQLGHKKPRLWRIPKTQTLINHMGFNNKGMLTVSTNVMRSHAGFKGLMGVSLGKNKNTSFKDTYKDYIKGMNWFYPVADYLVINLSSPNTVGLGFFTQHHYLEKFLTQVKEHQQECASIYRKHTPVLMKLSPDLIESKLTEIARMLLDFEMDGVIATNTTLSREGLEAIRHDIGGISGATLTHRATKTVDTLFNAFQGRIPIIASGGVMTAKDVTDKLEAGAKLVQLYTGLVYNGPKLVKEAVLASQKVKN